MLFRSLDSHMDSRTLVELDKKDSCSATFLGTGYYYVDIKVLILLCFSIFIFNLHFFNDNSIFSQGSCLLWCCSGIFSGQPWRSYYSVGTKVGNISDLRNGLI